MNRGVQRGSSASVYRGEYPFEFHIRRAGGCYISPGLLHGLLHFASRAHPRHVEHPSRFNYGNYPLTV